MSYVYKYVDLNDGETKYVGIVNGHNIKDLRKRIREHKSDEWVNNDFMIYYLVVENKTDAEFLESAFISYYRTGDFYNISKARWGDTRLVDLRSFKWKQFVEEPQERYVQNKQSNIISQHKKIKNEAQINQENEEAQLWTIDMIRCFFILTKREDVIFIGNIEYNNKSLGEVTVFVQNGVIKHLTSYQDKKEILQEVNPEYVDDFKLFQKIRFKPNICSTFIDTFCEKMTSYKKKVG